MPNRKSTTAGSYTANNEVTLVRGGKDYFDVLVEMIENAKEQVHFQTYIYEHDETGHLVAAALKRAAARKVAVYLMADGYASQGLSTSFIDELKQAGIHFRFFEPVFKSRNFYFGRRMHHKVVVTDAKQALVGGVNISNRYNDLPGEPAWLDFALLTRGEVAQQLCVLCWKTWKGFPVTMDTLPCEKNEMMLKTTSGQASKVRMRRNDWVRRKNEISATYVEMFRTANKEIIILCSYFLPGKIIRRLMARALQRGVIVRVIATGNSDIMLAKYAERWLYDWLLRKGVVLYEYEANVLHGKLAVCDAQWMTVGSYNVNNISAYASLELNLDVKDAAFAERVKQVLEQIIANDCRQITVEQLHKSNNLLKRFANWFSYHFIRFVLYLFTFYFKRQG